jgi:hypothetical protein
MKKQNLKRLIGAVLIVASSVAVVASALEFEFKKLSEEVEEMDNAKSIDGMKTAFSGLLNFGEGLKDIRKENLCDTKEGLATLILKVEPEAKKTVDALCGAK